MVFASNKDREKAELVQKFRGGEKKFSTLKPPSTVSITTAMRKKTRARFSNGPLESVIQSLQHMRVSMGVYIHFITIYPPPYIQRIFELLE